MNSKSKALWTMCTGAVGALALGAAFSANPERAGSHEGSSVPPEFREPYQSALQGQPFTLNEKNMLFMSGIGSTLLENCGLPRSQQDRLTMGLFIKSGQDLAAMGNQYANPNLGQTFKSMTGGMAVYLAGVKVAQSVDCAAPDAKRLADGIVKAVESNQRGADGGESIFVRTCTPTYSQAQCQCLANLGRAAFPNIHQMPFHREVIKGIIHRTPVVMMQISMVCGVVKY